VIEHLTKLESLRGLHGRDVAFFHEVGRVKQFQHERLARTYSDLASDPRHAPATAFFLHELYGAKDSALRDRDLIRMYPTIKRVLPEFAFNTVQMALELDVISEEFDQQLTRALQGREINALNYAAAFREVGRRESRLRQVVLMREVGKQLDAVVKKPLIYSTLKMLRTPARLAGLDNMQRFLEAGFTAFKHMKGADYFLETIAARETKLITMIFENQPNPFDAVLPPS
jgi:hypothetical protein